MLRDLLLNRLTGLLILLYLSFSLSAQTQPLPKLGVYILEGLSELTLSSSEPYEILDASQIIYELPANTTITLRQAASGTHKLLLTVLGAERSLQKVYFRHKSSESLFTITGAALKRTAIYRGDLEFSVGESTMSIINHIDVEDYLKSVVASEMPSSWPLEALKTQAVCARTYTASALTKKKL